MSENVLGIGKSPALQCAFKKLKKQDFYKHTISF